MGKHLNEFVEELSSEFTIDGAEITERHLIDGKQSMKVKYKNEVGTLIIERDNDDLTLTYDVKRGRKEIKKGIMGAVSGARLGGLLKGVLSGRDLSDELSNSIGNAVSTGADKAYQGYEESKESRAKFAQLLASTVDEVKNEILQKYQRINDQKTEAESQNKAEVAGLEETLQKINLAILSLNEELPFAEIEEELLAKIKARIARSESLYAESLSEFDAGNIDEAEVKSAVALKMIQKAQDMFNKI